MAISIPDVTHVHSGAKELLNLCRNQFFFAFYGDLGAGKTTLIKAICEELGCEDNVVSPTYSIINEYRIKADHSTTATTIYHMDFYRLKSLDEALDIGIEEYFDDPHAYCFVEWPELVEPVLPTDVVRVYITKEKNNSRTLRIEQ